MKALRAVRDRDFEDLWNQCSLWVILLIGAYAFDALSTIHFMTKNGIYYETHPLVKYSAMTYGPVIGTILSAFLYKTIAAIWLALYLKHIRIWLLIPPMIIAFTAGFINFFISSI